MAGPNFSTAPGQEFEFENPEQIERWLKAGYVEVVEIPGGGRRLENAGARTSHADTPGQPATAPVTGQPATGEGAKADADSGKPKDESPKSKPAAKPSSKSDKAKK